MYFTMSLPESANLNAKEVLPNSNVNRHENRLRINGNVHLYIYILRKMSEK